MAGQRSRSRETLAVLAAFVGNPDSEVYGLQVCTIAGLPSGSGYPILARLEQEGALSSRWETDAEASRHPGRRRRYYRLTEAGTAMATGELERARAQLAAPPRPRSVLLGRAVLLSLRRVARKAPNAAFSVMEEREACAVGAPRRALSPSVAV